MIEELAHAHTHADTIKKNAIREKSGYRDEKKCDDMFNNKKNAIVS